MFTCLQAAQYDTYNVGVTYFVDNAAKKTEIAIRV